MTDSSQIRWERAGPWFSQCRSNTDARLRLFCFPYAGGGASIYRMWPESLPAFVEVCPLELPGRGRRLKEPAFTQLRPMVEAAAQALRPELTKPFALFGHSMGALVAFELARLFEREAGLKPARVFVSARRAPHLPDDEPNTYNLPHAEFLEDVRRLNGTPKEVLEHEELLELVIPLLRADFEVCQTYQYIPGTPLACPISAFGGVLDPDVHREHLEAWREHTSAGFSLHMFPGDHFHINSSQFLLLKVLSQELESIFSQVRKSTD